MLALLPPLAIAAAPSREIADKQADLGELRGKIEALRKDLSESEGNRQDAASRLREAERRISRLQHELDDLAGQRGRLEKKLKNLDSQQEALARTLREQQSQLESLVYRQYLRGNRDSLQLLLNGDDPAQVARDLHYLSVLAQQRADLLGDIRGSLEKKKTLAASTRERTAELAEIESEQQKRRSELEKQREERQAIYAQMSDKVNAQRKEIGQLQRDERQLSQLIERLSRILAAQAAREAEQARQRERDRARELARRHEAAPGREPPRPPADDDEPPRRPRAGDAENPFEPMPSDARLAGRKGSLRLPVAGAVRGRFGSPREGGGTWRGVFIRAVQGTPVKAIASGRVVFADWMRGFGNLLIVDHGDGYLSIYGNNDALLKRVGQAVRGGDALAAVGNSGGNPETGLYFELRHQGQPIDPMQWASLK